MMKKLLFANGRVVNEGRIEELDLLVAGGRIERLGGGPVPAGARVIDLEGLHVLPGLIDDQVHFREPGLTHKATIASESLAAICGGVTSYFDMPNNSPPAVDRAAVAAKKAIAAGSSHANYGFYLGATNDNAEEIARATPSGRLRAKRARRRRGRRRGCVRFSQVLPVGEKFELGIRAANHGLDAIPRTPTT